MDLRARQCDGVIKIGVVELYSNGKEDAIKPFDMPPHEKKSWENHADNVIKVIKHFVPNAEIHLVPSGVDGLMYLIKEDIKLVNISLSGINNTFHNRLAENAFVVVASGNNGDKGETPIATRIKGCAVGAVNSKLEPQNYSGWGNGAVKTCAITGIKDYTGVALNGTSFSAPVVTGLLAQWYIWFYDKFGVYPSIKHTNRFVIENSHDIFEDAWDLRTGYGLFRLPKQFKQKVLEVKDGVSSGVVKWYVEDEVTSDFKEMLLAPFSTQGRFVASIRDIGNFADMTVDWKEDIATGIFID